MFEVGKDYKVVTLESDMGSDNKLHYYESSIVMEVGEVDGPLVKFLGPDYSKIDSDLIAGFGEKGPRSETIINTNSLFFVRAELINS